MDTFSLSLSMSSIIKSKYLSIFPIYVAVFHFLFPLIGNNLGIKILLIFNIASDILLGIILILLSINILIDYLKKEDINIKLNMFSIILLAFSVSIDSFTIGLGLSNLTNNIYLSTFLFSICSFSFTMLGLIIGKYSNKLIGKYASIIGIILLMILGIYHLL